MVISDRSFRREIAQVRRQFTAFTCSLSWEFSRYQGPAGFRPRAYRIVSGAPVTAEFFSRMAFDATGSGVNSYKTGVTRVTGVACTLNLLKLMNKTHVTLALMM